MFFDGCCMLKRDISQTMHDMFKRKNKVGGKFQFLTKILTKSAEETLKNAAHLRNDQTMITAVTGIDLIAKEFSKHQTCYINCTRISRETKNSASSSERDTTGDFQSVCNVIEKLVLGQQKCVSMETIVSSYGINEGDKQQRYRLKQRLLNKYKEKLLFISYEQHSPQLVISKDCLEKQNLTNIVPMQYSQASCSYSSRGCNKCNQ